MAISAATERATFQGHTRRVSSVCFSRDGAVVLSGSLDRTLRLWEVPGGRCLRVFEGLGSEVNGVALSPDGHTAFSASGELLAGGDMVRLWNRETGRTIRDLRGHEGEVSALAVDAPRGRLVTGGVDTTVRVWDLASGECRHTLRGHGGWVRAVALTPDGLGVLSGGMDGSLRLWDATTGACRWEASAHAGGVHGVLATPAGERVLSCGRDKALRTWDLRTGKALGALEGHVEAVRGAGGQRRRPHRAVGRTGQDRPPLGPASRPLRLDGGDHGLGARGGVERRRALGRGRHLRPQGRPVELEGGHGPEGA